MINSCNILVKSVVDDSYIKEFSSFVFGYSRENIFVYNIGEFGTDAPDPDKNVYCTKSMLKGEVFCDLSYTNFGKIDFCDLLKRVSNWTERDEVMFYIDDPELPYTDVYYEISQGTLKKKVLNDYESERITIVEYNPNLD